MSTPNNAPSWTALILGCLVAAAPAFMPVVHQLETQWPILGAAAPVIAVIWNHFVSPVNK